MHRAGYAVAFNPCEWLDIHIAGLLHLLFPFSIRGENPPKHSILSMIVSSEKPYS